MSTAEKYIGAAYAVFLLVLLAYVVIISTKLARLERELTDIAQLAQERRV